MPTRRNPVVRAGAILRKGGVHRQSASGHRHQGKRSLCDELDDWYADAQESEDSAAELECDDKTSAVEHHLPKQKRRQTQRKRKGWGSTPRSFNVTAHIKTCIILSSDHRHRKDNGAYR